jgi:hypothetical protein
MRSIRTLPFVLEAATLIVVVGFVYLMLFTLEREVRYQYVQRQYADLEKIELTIKMFLDDRRRALESVSENGPAGLAVSGESFSDIVQLDSRLQITRILRNEPGSRIFEGYVYSEKKYRPAAGAAGGVTYCLFAHCALAGKRRAWYLRPAETAGRLSAGAHRP